MLIKGSNQVMKASGVLSGLAAAGLIAGVSAPAHAVLQIAIDVSGVTFDCVDNAACDTNPAVGTLQLATGTAINGVVFDNKIAQSAGTPANAGLDTLNISSLSVTNTTNALKTVDVVLSDTDFLGPVSSFETAGNGTWQSTIGSTITLNWWDDPANAQGASSVTDTPGALIDTFSNTALDVVQGFSHSGAGLVSDSGPFSMTEQAIYTLQPGGELLNRGETLIKSAIPEPSTWAMMLFGFAGLGYAGFRRARKTPALQV